MAKTFLPLLALLLAVDASADWHKVSAQDFTMAPPPVAGSAEDKADFAELLKLQNARTPGECSLAGGQLSPVFSSIYSTATFTVLKPSEHAAVTPLINAAFKVLADISGEFKKQYSRPRPYDADPRVQPCIKKPGGATAYPSLHAAAGTFDACLLGKLFPARANALASYGKLVGDMRAMAGVHHPSDVVAGQTLGADVCARLLNEPDFAAELDAVKKTLP